MNQVKYYRRKRDGMVAVVVVRVSQTRKELERFVRCKPSAMHPRGVMQIPPKYPSVAAADLAMAKSGFTRKRLYNVIKPPAGVAMPLEKRVA